MRLLSVLVLGTAGLWGFTQNSTSEPPHAMMLSGTALVPLNALAAAVDATVTVAATTSTMTLTRDDRTLVLTAYNTTAMRNNQPLSLQAPPLQRGGQWFVPVRGVTLAFGADVAVRANTERDPAKTVVVQYQGKTTLFRAVEDARMIRANFTGSRPGELAFAVANVYGIDAYNSLYVSDIVPLEVWVVRGSRELWRVVLDKGVSINQLQALDVTGDRHPDLLLNYLTRHSYMGPFPGSIYHTNIYRWNNRTFRNIFSLDYSRDHGQLFRVQPNPARATTFILVDTNWRNNEDSAHYIVERYTWNGNLFRLTRRVVTSRPITGLRAAQRILR